MTKRVVWYICLTVAALGLLSMVYRMTTVTHFNSADWQNCDEPKDYIARRDMLPEVNAFFSSGKINSQASAEKLLGKPDKMADADAHVWYYSLGGQNSPSSPEPITWLELTFDNSEKLQRHRVTQELIVPEVTAPAP